MVLVMLYSITVLILNIKLCLSGIPLIQATLALYRHISFWNQDDLRTENLPTVGVTLEVCGHSTVKGLVTLEYIAVTLIKQNKTKILRICRPIGQGSSLNYHHIARILILVIQIT